MKVAMVAAALGASLAPSAALAHGEAPGKPGFETIFTGWELEPLAIVGLGLGGWLYWTGLRAVNRAHPRAPFPAWRAWCFAGGMAALVVALLSPLARYDTSLFSVHMWQHMLITLVAAPLLALGAPITLALRAASARVRREWLLPVLHSRVVAALSFPVVAWLVLGGTMWFTHFSPVFDAALESAWLHRLEHLWYLVAALLFWWPAVAADPVRWRMNHPLRLLYLFLQMPQNSFLGVAIYSSSNVIFDHYATVERTWGPSPLSDQELAGVTMWVVGDLLFLLAVGLVALGWVRHEELEARRQDRALARKRAAATASAEAPR